MPLADHKRPSSSRVTRRVGAVLAVSAALLFTAACNDGDTSTGETPAGGGTDFAAYQSCLQENGVTMTLPSGAPGGLRPSGGVRPSGDIRPSGGARPSGAPGGGPNGGGFPGGGGFGKPAGVDDATWQKAQTACESLRPSGRPGGGPNGGGPDGGGDNGMSAAYRTCLSDNGVTLADGGLNTADPAVAKAIETCKVLQPAATPSS